MDTIKKFALRYKHFLWLLLFIPNQMLFWELEKNVKPVYYMFSRIDNYIPFVKEFIIPYLFWYVYFMGAFIYLGFASKKDFMRLFMFIFSGMTISCIIYMLFPNAQSLRPVIAETTDPFLRLIKNIYTVDTPTNVAPSMHVLNSIAVHSVLVNCELFKKNWWVKITSFICMVSISASTVLIKQHSIEDVAWACILSAALYISIYVIPKVVDSRKSIVEDSEGILISKIS
jgi:membrane-associated phospholipid phosphatase